jgi:hypothetical protein
LQALFPWSEFAVSKDSSKNPLLGAERRMGME